MLLDKNTKLKVWKMVTENVGVAQLASEFGLCNYPLNRHTVMCDQLCSVSSRL